jgi:hypothetical protein
MSFVTIADINRMKDPKEKKLWQDIKVQHDAINSSMKKQGMLERDLIKISKDMGNTKTTTKKFATLKTRYNNKYKNYVSVSRDITSSVSKKDALLKKAKK